MMGVDVPRPDPPHSSPRCPTFDDKADEATVPGASYCAPCGKSVDDVD